MRGAGAGLRVDSKCVVVSGERVVLLKMWGSSAAYGLRAWWANAASPGKETRRGIELVVLVNNRRPGRTENKPESATKGRGWAVEGG